MNNILSVQLIYIFRILLAALCGALIGYERKNRGKRAGIRTHIIVAIASALMMLVSKYGFFDLISGTKAADPSRIAAQVVSGVGFLGAGMIYFNRKTLQGLTTAAGIWATSGIGLAMGAGMYFIGIFTTIIIIVSQILLHKNLKFLRTPTEETITVVIEDSDEAISFVKQCFEKYGIHTERMNFKRIDGALIELETDIVADMDFDLMNLLDVAKTTSYIKSIKGE